MTAFDMDYLTNPNVDSGYARLREMLSRVGMQYGTYLWDPQYKGLDDYMQKRGGCCFTLGKCESEIRLYRDKGECAIYR